MTRLGGGQNERYDRHNAAFFHIGDVTWGKPSLIAKAPRG